MRSDVCWWSSPDDDARQGDPFPKTQAGHWICWDCPREWHTPPYLPFTFRTHITTHLRRFSRHLILWWCRRCARSEHAWHPHWRLQGYYWIHDAPVEKGCLIVCIYRRVTVKYPDGRTFRLLLKEDPEKPMYCSTCRMAEATFRAKTMTPHDDLGHQEIYYQAKVTRGRRLSARQVSKLQQVITPPEPAAVTLQESFSGVPVDAGRRP